VLSSRRSSMTGILVGLGLVAAAGATVFAISRAASSDDPEEAREEMRKSLEMQRDYGWKFGAVSETVAFDAIYTQKYAREALKTLEEDLAPGNVQSLYYVRTLFQSPEAVPRLTLPDGEQARVTPLAEALQPILTPGMTVVEKRGRALGALLAQATMPVVVVVDLVGEEAVAFAAGASSSLTPVFLFDNWPHPRGVVPSHRTLGAAVYYQPVFAKAKKERKPTAPPMYVLERGRLATYTDSASQFDNRYVAKLPSKVAPSGTKVLYVVPTASALPELDDLNGLFLEWLKAGVEVRALAADAFVVNGDTAVFGGDPKIEAAFFGTYPWKPPTVTRVEVPLNEKAERYAPLARPSASQIDAATIGVAAVMIGVGTGLILGSKLNRNGSWNRVNTSYGGG
jgi:hypothetical protein